MININSKLFIWHLITQTVNPCKILLTWLTCSFHSGKGLTPQAPHGRLKVVIGGNFRSTTF